jgi:molybdopterin-guanine dinucleotide biosynthesis protein A
MQSKDQVTGYVLAGGESSRMGQNKALLPIGGKPLVVRTARLVESVAGGAVVIGKPEAYRELGLHAASDDWPSAGPLGGIATALGATKAPWNLVVACDLPYLTKAWLNYVIARGLWSQADAVVPMNARGAEPLCAIYHKRCEPAIRAELERGVRGVTEALEGIVVETIAPHEWKAFDSDGLLFKNMNSPQDYQEARTRLDGEQEEMA